MSIRLSYYSIIIIIMLKHAIAHLQNTNNIEDFFNEKKQHTDVMTKLDSVIIITFNMSDSGSSQSVQTRKAHTANSLSVATRSCDYASQK